jgi:hypothetical protein
VPRVSKDEQIRRLKFHITLLKIDKKELIENRDACLDKIVDTTRKLAKLERRNAASVEALRELVADCDQNYSPTASIVRKAKRVLRWDK